MKRWNTCNVRSTTENWKIDRFSTNERNFLQKMEDNDLIDNDTYIYILHVWIILRYSPYAADHDEVTKYLSLILQINNASGRGWLSIEDRRVAASGIIKQKKWSYHIEKIVDCKDVKCTSTYKLTNKWICRSVSTRSIIQQFRVRRHRFCRIREFLGVDSLIGRCDYRSRDRPRTTFQVSAFNDKRIRKIWSCSEGLGFCAKFDALAASYFFTRNKRNDLPWDPPLFRVARN